MIGMSSDIVGFTALDPVGEAEAGTVRDDMQTMNIGDAAQASGVSAKMIRHYESVGLFPTPQRTDAGYRQYSGSDVHTLRFIRHARDLGFSIVQIGQLVSLWHDRARPSKQVKALAEAHIEELERKAQDLLAMKATLEHLVHRCRGDGRPECPIIDSLAEQLELPAEVARSPSKLRKGVGR